MEDKSAKPTKRTLLAQLSKKELVDVSRRFELPVVATMPEQEILDLLMATPAATLNVILPRLERATLKDLCKAFALSLEGRDKATFVDRLLTAVDPARTGPQQGALPFEAPDYTLEVDVEPKKPRLAWQGMNRKEAVAAVPTQIVEIVRPRLAREKGALLDADMGTTMGERDSELPPNRLIWTNDNLVALQTLLDERDPTTKAYRYRGKVDLVYIDPPFMVNNDFRADNTIDIDIDEEEGVQAKKEPSLVEHLAYRDTWRQGLDSFLSMLKRRLELLKDLLAPTGSIYVHLDWHAVHYVKVLMDELFGYENFQSEVVWKRTSARSDAKGFNHIHDTIIAYGGAKAHWQPVFGPLDADYVREKYNNIDPSNGRRYMLDNLTSPNPRPNMMYAYDGYSAPTNGWRYSLETMREMDRAGLIARPDDKGKRLRFKRYLEDEGMPLSSVWTDVFPVNSQAVERSGYPTQKPIALLERIISASCPPDGTILDCFMGSGTTCEAAERLGRRWVGIDNGKFAVHLARKRLIQLSGQSRPIEKPAYDYVECGACANIDRKLKATKGGQKRRQLRFRPSPSRTWGSTSARRLGRTSRSERAATATR